MRITRECITELLIEQTGKSGEQNYVLGQVESASRAVLSTLGGRSSKRRVFHDVEQASNVLLEIKKRLANGPTDVTSNLKRVGITAEVLERTEAVIRGL